MNFESSFTARLESASSGPRFLQPEVTRSGDTVTVRVTPEMLPGSGVRTVRLYSPLTTLAAPAEGYLFYPAAFTYGCVLTRLENRPDAESVSRLDSLSFAGVGGCDRAVMVQILSGNADGRFHADCTDGVYHLCPEFLLDGDPPEEELIVSYRSLPGADYSDMARIYRAYQIREKGCVPLKERIKHNPYLKYAAESMEFRVRMGWKPVPTPVPHQTPENEPPLKVVCDVRKLRAILDEMRRQNVGETELCLVGWSQGGHDGRFPQLVPSDPRYGTEEEMKEVISHSRSLGYRMVCHTGSLQSYEIADNFDIHDMAHKPGPDGSLVPCVSESYVNTGGLSGGYPYLLCSRQAYEKYAVTELPKVRAYGFEGLHFVDELTSVETIKCYHPDHPADRKQAEESYRRIARLSRSLFGGFQSEGWMDFMNADTDYIMYTSFQKQLDHSMNPLFDEMIPLWQLVYHGIVLSNPSSATVNHVLKGSDEHLRFLEYGGRPLLYLYSKFGERKNWMGDIDLRCETLADVPDCVRVIRETWEEFEPLRYLQFEFMEKHEKLSEGVYRVTYSDGTKMTVNYPDRSCTVEKDGAVRVIRV